MAEKTSFPNYSSSRTFPTTKSPFNIWQNVWLTRRINGNFLTHRILVSTRFSETLWYVFAMSI